VLTTDPGNSLQFSQSFYVILVILIRIRQSSENRQTIVWR